MTADMPKSQSGIIYQVGYTGEKVQIKCADCVLVQLKNGNFKWVPLPKLCQNKEVKK